MIYVIGSGPAAIAAVVALVNRGLEVTILDAGKTLEAEKQATLARLSKQEPEAWNRVDLDALRGDDQKTKHGSVHVKRTYGSDYPYADADPNLEAPLRGTLEPADFNYSRARGGLSQVWGASLLPASAADITNWPIGIADLEPHYRAVLDFMPSTGVEDGLASILPTYTTRATPWQSSRQTSEFLADLEENKDLLKNSGFHFGRSRMAVSPNGDDRRHGCVYCGLCLYGCPYSLIHSSAFTLDSLLLTDSRVTYVKDHVVEKLEPMANGTGVKIHALNIARGEQVSFDAERVFVGCGVLPTASIVLNSLKAYNTPLQMLDSQYFIYPFFRFKKVDCVQTESLHSLAQAFIEIDDPAVSRARVHLEVFSYSDFLKRALLETPLRFFLKFPWIADQIFGRLFVLQGFIHSKDSSHITVELKKEGDDTPMLSVHGKMRWRGIWTSIKAGLKLTASALRLRGLPVIPAIQIAKPGRSYHSGGTFPMREIPGKFETDTLGRLPGLDRVHLVDASVLPSIPATTITLTIMANAHRIATSATQSATL